MEAVDILTRSLSKKVPIQGAMLQYHGRSDRHGQLICWGILFDLMLNSQVLRSHVEDGKVVFGINHTLTSFSPEKKKRLDLVLCRPKAGAPGPKKPRTLQSMATMEKYGIELSSEQQTMLDDLPVIKEGPVGSVLVALEAKACMTEHIKALPRLYDELNSSHQIVHGHSSQALSIGFFMVNAAEEFYSPTNLNKPGPNKHKQPHAMERAVAQVAGLPRRSHHTSQGFDGLGIVAVDMNNDGTSPCTLVSTSPAPAPDDVLHYDSMIQRMAHEYDSRFSMI
ncbi:hypothetical protein ACSHWO_14610 [Streptomyces sp. HUAS TT3]|uniref:Uncharacterized protein n=1 Tax=Streptomyces celluloflavus TaxID=58344 RepID=A0ABW7RM50_9ACTN|nr:hypothetical protein OG717_22030 [Streptomyces celluloflavus]